MFTFSFFPVPLFLPLLPLPFLPSSPPFLPMQISYTATSIELSDKRRFPNFLRTIPSDNASIITVSTVVRQFGWEQVAIVTSRDVLFSTVRM